VTVRLASASELPGEAVSRYRTAAVAPAVASVVAIPTASVLLSLSQVSDNPHSNGLAAGVTCPDQVRTAPPPVTG
jgi:hypothetical protein